MSILIRNHAVLWRMAVAALLAAVMPVMAGDGKQEGRSMVLTSTVFFQDSTIPQRYTCDGSDISPPLAWSGLPAGTKSLVLIVDDPDAPDPSAPRMIWSHWVLYNLPPIAGDLPEGVPAKALPQGTLQGVNDWQRTGYGGPCPPVGRHRYFFKLYALDVVLPDFGRHGKATMEKAKPEVFLKLPVRSSVLA